MKKGKTKQVKSIPIEKSYIPDAPLSKFLHEWLHYHEKKASLTLAGKNLSDEDVKKINELRRMKVYILDNFIFPSMANLIHFFEALDANPLLSDAFDDDVVELLDPRKVVASADNIRMDSSRFRKNNLSRLIMSMVNVNLKKYPEEKPIDDFRIELMYQMLNIIGDQTDRLLEHEYGMNQIWKSFWEDYTRMLGWLALLTRSVKEEPKKYDRTIRLPTV